MNDDIKQIAALIGHQQAQEKRVTALIEEYQTASADLQRQREQLSQLIRELDCASGKMADTVRQSVSAALAQVQRELKEAGVEQQKPAISTLNQIVSTAQASVHALRREMSVYT